MQQYPAFIDSVYKELLTIEAIQNVLYEAPTAIAILDHEFRYIYVNDKWIEDYNLHEKQILGARHYDLFPDLPQRWKLCYEAALNGQNLSNHCDSYEWADGTKRYLEWGVQPWKTSTGSIAGITLYTRDITSRVEAEQALKDSKEQLNLVIEGSTDGLWDWDILNEKTAWSDRWGEIMGLDVPVEERSFKKFLELVHPDDRAKLVTAVQNHLDKGTPYQEVFRHYHPSGQLRYGLTRGKAIRNKEGVPYRMAGTITDITERTLLKQSLENTIKREKLLSQVMQLCHHTFDIASIKRDLVSIIGHYFNVDRCYIRIVAEKNEHGKDLNALYTNSKGAGFEVTDIPCFKPVEHARDEDGLSNIIFNIPDINHLQNELPATIYGYMLKHNIQSAVGFVLEFQKEVYGYLVLHQCEKRVWTKEEKETLESLSYILTQALYRNNLFIKESRAREIAEKADRKKGEFLANMSHELRTPLNAIVGFTELIQNEVAGELNEEYKEFAENIRVGADLLHSVIEDVIDISSAESGSIGLRPAMVNIIEVTKDLSTLLATRLKEKNINLHYDLGSTVKTVQADPLRFKQILLHLLSNAIKFNHHNGDVFIRFENYTDGIIPCLKIEIQDTGIGISEENLSDLFKPFYQVDGSSTRHYQGCGLGLALVKHLVELHNGVILVESELGQGATFTVLLPLE